MPMYSEQTTITDLKNGHYTLMWNSIEYEYWFDGDETIVLKPIKDVVEDRVDHETSELTRLSTETVTDYLTDPDMPFNTRC